MAFCHGLCCLDPCELSFSQKQTLFESRPISASVVVSAGDVDSNILEEEDDLDESEGNEIDFIDQFRILEHESLAKDDEIVYLQASLGALQESLIEKNQELAWTKTQLQDMNVEYQALSFKYEQLENQDAQGAIAEKTIEDDAEIRRLGLVANRFMLSRRCRFEEPCLQNLQLRKLHELELADVYYLSNVWSSRSATLLGSALYKELLPFLQQRNVIVQGNTTLEPRKTGFFAESTDFKYNYSGRNNVAIKFTPLINELLAVYHRLVEAKKLPKQNFNVAMVNLYQRGHSIGLHSDESTEIVTDSAILSFSFGVSTLFLMCDRNRRNLCKTLLESGSIFWMGAGCQKHYLHGAPNKIEGSNFRINITFRLQYPPLTTVDQHGLGDVNPWSEMVESNEAFIFQQKSLLREVYKYKDCNNLNKTIWNMMACELCATNLGCTKWYCYCGARHPDNVPLVFLEEFLYKMENDTHLEV